MMMMAVGMALTMAPATDSIMGSLPLAKAGVGSAVNDTTRQIGGALGVAVIGSVHVVDLRRRRSATLFAGHAERAGRRPSRGRRTRSAVPSPWPQKAPCRASDRLAVGGGQVRVRRRHAHGPARRGRRGVLGAIVVAVWLPARARDENVEEQAEEYAQENAGVVGFAPAERPDTVEI